MYEQAYSSLHLLGLKWTEGGGGGICLAARVKCGLLDIDETQLHRPQFILEGKTPLLLLMPATLLP